jgi:hypothetical protein
MSTSKRAWLEPSTIGPNGADVVVDRGEVDGEVVVGRAWRMPDGEVDIDVELHYRKWSGLVKATFPSARVAGA